MWWYLNSEGFFICRSTESVQREKAALKMWSCICKVQHLRGRGSIWASFIVISDWHSAFFSTWTRITNGMWKGIWKYSYYGNISPKSCYLDWGISSDVAVLKVRTKAWNMQNGFIWHDLTCLRTSGIKDSGGSIYHSSTAPDKRKGHQNTFDNMCSNLPEASRSASPRLLE